MTFNRLRRNLEGSDGTVHTPGVEDEYPACLSHHDTSQEASWTPTTRTVEGCDDCERRGREPRRVTHLRVLDLGALLAQHPQGRPANTWWAWIISVIGAHRNGELTPADPATWSGAVHRAIIDLAASTPLTGAGALFEQAYNQEVHDAS
ncbi:hypothetical protein [Amycolatopsis sp. TNS106]|uniref:hypothetical protein n=1 Tax=Amycolatopsis sp. TNS106 TaxID=2861750 RepID=UPI001C5873B6|nr:hypothetical protein [Amycolatopsis sp. TNS106]